MGHDTIHLLTHTHTHTHTHTQRKSRKSFKTETIKRLSRKCFCFSDSRGSRIFLVGQPWWPIILFIVPWPLHFEIHFAGLPIVKYLCWSIFSIKNFKATLLRRDPNTRVFFWVLSSF